MKAKIIFTIGHSTHFTREFLQMLKAFEVECLVDIRHYPGSRYCPQFRGYADYMQTLEFQAGLKELMQIARKKLTVTCALKLSLGAAIARWWQMRSSLVDLRWWIF